jgi:DNA repair exonuclease SbcCD ATPase subunit
MAIDAQLCLDNFATLKNRIQFLQEDLEKKEDVIDAGLLNFDNLNQAKYVITEVQKATQEKFKTRVESLVTMAIKSVYDRPFGFELIFERKRDKMECRPVIYEVVGDKKEYYEDPENELGGGILDICSFAMRIVMWSLEKPKSRNVIVLDEPMKNLGELITLGGQMLKEISHGLKFQLIIITHDSALIEIADRSWHVEHKNGESEVTMIRTKEDLPMAALQEPPKQKRRKRQ